MLKGFTELKMHLEKGLQRRKIQITISAIYLMNVVFMEHKKDKNGKIQKSKMNKNFTYVTQKNYKRTKMSYSNKKYCDE